jgi:hypothetical protein
MARCGTSDNDVPGQLNCLLTSQILPKLGCSLWRCLLPLHAWCCWALEFAPHCSGQLPLVPRVLWWQEGAAYPLCGQCCSRAVYWGPSATGQQVLHRASGFRCTALLLDLVQQCASLPRSSALHKSGMFSSIAPISTQGVMGGDLFCSVLNSSNMF